MTVTHYSSLETLAGTDHRDGTYRGGAWWASVARALDDLDERLARDAMVDAGPAGALVDAVDREPSLSNDVLRLIDDHARLAVRARRLRRLVAAVAGDQAAAPAVAAELAALAAAEDRYQQRSRALFWDSFARDIGGE